MNRAGWRALRGFLILAVMVALNTLVFQWLFHTSYVLWFVDHGWLIATAFTLVTLGWDDLNQNGRLIAVHPFVFLSGVLLLAGISFVTFSAALGSSHKGESRQQVVARMMHERALDQYTMVEFRSPGLNALAAGLSRMVRGLFLGAFAIVFAAMVVGWIVVVAPLQYLVNIIAGVLVRESQRSDLIVRWDPSGVREAEPVAKAQVEEESASGEDDSSGWVLSTFSAKPVTLTFTLGGLLLGGVSFIRSL